MSTNSWNQTLITQQAAGTAFTNSTTATSLLNGQAKLTLPAGILQGAGIKFKVRASGRISTAASTPGTLALSLMFGSVVAFAGGASPTLATSAANLTWIYEADGYLLTAGSGAAATIYADGKFLSAALSAATPIMLLPVSSSGAGTGFDSTVAFVVDLFATWSVASASNTIRCDAFDFTLCT